MEWSMLKVNDQGLVPVIVQDVQTCRVLMLGYMNQDAFEETTASGEMVYFSRSRQKRWKKGEGSGNTQKLVSIKEDCDKDTLLAQVEQKGVACHTGRFSCFDGDEDMREEGVLERLEAIIQKRKEIPVEGSYTNYLFDKGIDKMLKKVGEETAEVIIAAKNNDKEELLYEVSDLLYHMMVLLNEQEVSWSQVKDALSNRFPKS